MRRRSLVLSVLRLALVLCVLPASAAARVRIVIDAAHGGNDPGSRAGSASEKEWNLRFAKAIADNAVKEGFDVVLVRGKDESIDLDKRIERINTSEAALAIILHADRDSTGTRSGGMVVLHPPTNAPDPPGLLPWGWIPSWRYRANVRLAKALARSLGLDASFSNLSEKSGCMGEPATWEGRILCAPHTHLRYLVPTAVVLTPLFITSGSDLQAFASDSALEDFARKVTEGIRVYLHAATEENP